MNSPSTRLRVFWQPGCSSCVRVKEFLIDQQIAFESVNILEDATAIDQVRRLGAQGIPIVARGSEYVYAQSLVDVANFLGLQPPSATLLPHQLIERWLYFLDVARSLAADIPSDRLNFRPVPTRDRDLRQLAWHVFQIPDVFVRNVKDGFEDVMVSFSCRTPADIRSVSDIVGYGDGVIARLESWWEQLDDKKCGWDVKTDYGVHQACEFLERSTWHSAHHTRQLQAALLSLEVMISRGIPDDKYAGLPMPKTVWE